MTFRTRFTQSSVLAALATTACLGCADSLPTHPADETGTPPATFPLATEVGAAFAIVIEDARLRILPALKEAPRADGLRQALDALSAALASQDRAALVHAIARADAALAALSGAEASEAAADLETVRLILTEARPLLDEGSTASSR